MTRLSISLRPVALAIGLLAWSAAPTAQVGLRSFFQDAPVTAPSTRGTSLGTASSMEPLPSLGVTRVDTLRAGAPDAYLFDGTAGERIWVRARGLHGVAPTLCLLTAAAWEAMNGGPPTDPASPVDAALICDRFVNWYTRESTLMEVLPVDGEYVVLVTSEDARASGTYTVTAIETGTPVPQLLSRSPGEAGATQSEVLGDGDAWEVTLGQPVGTHYVAGRTGDILSITVRSEVFQPYVEIGTWYGAGFQPILGSSSGLPTSTARITLPADGVYTVRVGAADARRGAYTIHTERTPAPDWAERFPGGGDPSDRYALIVSVSDYPGLGPNAFQPDLTGPAVDGDQMVDLLTKVYGFKLENVVLLRDVEATREAIAEAFRRHLGQAGAGGTALFHYAGHGIQLPAEAVPAGWAEPDGQDEALVLWGRGGEVAYLLDHELGGLADALPAEHTVVMLDNCFSGDGTRGEAGVGIRLVNYETVANRIVMPDSVLGDPAASPERRQHVLLSAATSAQPSLELEGFGPDGGLGGVFTGSLVRALREAPPEATFADLIEAIRPAVARATAETMRREGFPPQEPQAEGAQRTTRIRDALGLRR